MEPHQSLVAEAKSAKVENGQLVIVASGRADLPQDIPVAKFLERVRQAFKMDVVFISQFVDGRRVIRAAASDPEDELAVRPGMSDPLEESYCHHVVSGRLPEVIPDTREVPFAMGLSATNAAKVGSHLATALVTADGKVYGTICCYSHHPLPHLGHMADLEALRSIAELLSSAVGDWPPEEANS